MTKPQIYHIRIGDHARAFITAPNELHKRLYLWLRGWRHTHWHWFTKQSKGKKNA